MVSSQGRMWRLRGGCVKPKRRCGREVRSEAMADGFHVRGGGHVRDPGRGFLQLTGFVLDPTGQVVVSAYPGAAVGRLVPDDVVALVGYLAQHYHRMSREG